MTGDSDTLKTVFEWPAIEYRYPSDRISGRTSCFSFTLPNGPAVVQERHREGAGQGDQHTLQLGEGDKQHQQGILYKTRVVDPGF